MKTRLGAGIGMAAAANWFRAQSSALIRRLSRDARWRTVLAVAPDLAVNSSAWPPDAGRWPQGSGNLGDRMARALRRFGPGPVIIIGADIPGIEPHHIAEAVSALRAHDAVFGPAPDGGYWLVGLRGGKTPRGFMQGVRWSSEHTLSDTLKTLAPGARVARLEELRDVDTVDDL